MIIESPIDILAIARQYVAWGISVIPVKSDGTKSPAIRGWRTYSTERPSEATLQQWFGTPGYGIGIPCGPASGHLVVLDFEFHETSAFDEWFVRLTPDLQTLVRCFPTVTTPSGGKHLWVRLAESQLGGKLARYAAGKTKIEIRGEGHMVLAPGCPRSCHKSGRLYEWAISPAADGDGFPVLDDETWSQLCLVAAECNAFQPPEPVRDGEPRGTPAGTGSPGHDFNRRGSWTETGLWDAGWTWAKQAGDERGLLTRPGKASGTSASLGMVSSRRTSLRSSTSGRRACPSSRARLRTRDSRCTRSSNTVAITVMQQENSHDRVTASGPR